MAGFGRSNSLSINTSGGLLYVYIYTCPLPHLEAKITVLHVSSKPASASSDRTPPTHEMGPALVGLWGRITHVHVHHANGPAAEIRPARGNRVPGSSAPRRLRPSPSRRGVSSGPRQHSSRPAGCSAVHPHKHHSHPSRPAYLGTRTSPPREPPGGSSAHQPSSRSLSRVVVACSGGLSEETQTRRARHPNRVDYSVVRVPKRSPLYCK